MADNRDPADVLATMALDGFVRWIRDEAGNSALTPEDLVIAARRYKDANRDYFVKRIHDAVEKLVTVKQAKTSGQARKNPFERVLVQRLAHLFPRKGELDLDGNQVSRRALPGIFHAMEMMIGHDRLSEHRERTDQLIETLTSEGNGDVDWDQVYDDPRANEMVDDVLAGGLAYFDSPQERIEWFQHLINANLAPAEHYAFEGEQAALWHLSEKAAEQMLTALMTPLYNRARGDEKAEIAKKYGPDALKRLAQFFRPAKNG